MNSYIDERSKEKKPILTPIFFMYLHNFYIKWAIFFLCSWNMYRKIEWFIILFAKNVFQITLFEFGNLNISKCMKEYLYTNAANFNDLVDFVALKKE